MFNSNMNENLLKRKQGQPKSFGEVFDNYNWVECASAKNPDKNYYFNVRTHCTTWTRPVPENVDVPFFNPYAVPQVKNADKDELSPPVSPLNEIDQDDEDYNEDASERKFFEIAAKLYYHGFRNSRKIQRNIPEENSETGKAIAATDFLEIEYSSEDSLERLRTSSPLSVEFRQESFQEKSTESDDSCQCSICLDRNEGSRDNSCSYKSSTSHQTIASRFSVPRLQPITYSDLVTEPHKKSKLKQKKRKIDSQESGNNFGRLTPEKRIYDMYGIRTVNYDPVFRFINSTNSLGVATSCLSDSSVPSSVSEKKTFDDILLHIRDPVLSESSSISAEPGEKSHDDRENLDNVQKSCVESSQDISKGKELRIILSRIDLNKYFKEKSTRNESSKKAETERSIGNILKDETFEGFSDSDDSLDEIYIPEDSNSETGDEYFSSEKDVDELSNDTNFGNRNIDESSHDSAPGGEKWFIVKNLVPMKISLRKISNCNSMANKQIEPVLNEVSEISASVEKTNDLATNCQGETIQDECLQKKSSGNLIASNTIQDLSTNFKDTTSQARSPEKNHLHSSTSSSNTEELSRKSYANSLSSSLEEFIFKELTTSSIDDQKETNQGNCSQINKPEDSLDYNKYDSIRRDYAESSATEEKYDESSTDLELYVIKETQGEDFLKKPLENSVTDGKNTTNLQVDGTENLLDVESVLTPSLDGFMSRELTSLPANHERIQEQAQDDENLKCSQNDDGENLVDCKNYLSEFIQMKASTDEKMIQRDDQGSSTDFEMDKSPEESPDGKPKKTGEISGWNTLENSSVNDIKPTESPGKMIWTMSVKSSETDTSALKTCSRSFGNGNQKDVESGNVNEGSGLSDVGTRCAVVLKSKLAEIGAKTASLKEQLFPRKEKVFENDEFQSDWTSEETITNGSDSTYVCSEIDSD